MALVSFRFQFHPNNFSVGTNKVPISSQSGCNFASQLAKFVLLCSQVKQHKLNKQNDAANARKTHTQKLTFHLQSENC